jgi:photosystem II stability/assembly factor-like uncharacterized protein/regulation of enolase protein 1 (concanavalin A-like superfamily)
MKHIKIVGLVLILLYSGLAGAQTSQWSFLGPVDFPTNISGQINGIGRVCEIKFAPNSTTSMFACSASGGLWKSTDAGAHWTEYGTDNLPQMNLASVCIDFTDSNIVYIGSGDPNYYSIDLGVWKTTNGGATWSQVNASIGTRMAVDLLMDPTNHMVLLAATNSGIWKTTDGGATWTEKLVGNQFTDMVWQPLAGSSIVYASSMNKYFRSTDRGETWTEITAGFNGLLGAGTRLAVSAANPAIVYVGTVNQEGTIFRSIDSGLNFSIQYNNPAWSLTGYDSTGGGQGNYNFCIEANPSNADQLFLGSHNIMRSNDGGVTWSKLTNWWQTVHTDMHDYLFQPGNSTNLYQANDGGVWMTASAGVNWVQKSDGLGATENYNAAVSPLYAKLISTGTQDNGELVYIDQAWKTNRGGDWTTKMQMDFSPQKFVYYFDDVERRSLPSGGGNTYAVPAAVTGNNIKHAFSPDNQNLAYVSGNSIWQTKNLLIGEPVWTQIVTGNSVIRAMAVCANYPNIFAYSVGGKFYITHDALSASPTFQNYSYPTSTATDIVISSKDTNLIFVIINSKVYRSQDGGMTFTDYTGTLPAINHTKLFLDDYSSNQSLYVGNTQGVFYRNAAKADWDNYSGVLPTIAPIKNFMCFNDGGVDARLYIAYYGRGVWETPLENTHTCSTPVVTGSAWNGNAFNISWTASGANQYKLQYRELGTIAWTEQTVSATSYSILNYAGCTSYEARVQSMCTSDTSLWSAKVYFQTPTNPLNNDFDNHQDIGGVGAAGSVCYDAINSRYTVYAAGEDIWDKQDEFHFLYKKLAGDVTISARVKHIGNIYGWAKGGVMIRETLDTDSRHAICAMTPGNGFAMQWREQTNDYSTNKDTAGTAPGYVKLERLGNTMTSYFSLDGTTWNVLETATINMVDTVYVGLANCSHIDTAINDAVFDHIIINGNALSVNETVKDNLTMTVYPNPTQEQLTISLHQTDKGNNIAVTIVDVNGNPVLKKQFKTLPSNSYSIDVKTLPVGTYFIEVQANKRMVTKFVKQ